LALKDGLEGADHQFLQDALEEVLSGGTPDTSSGYVTVLAPPFLTDICHKTKFPFRK
jgi:hypothetical protein